MLTNLDNPTYTEPFFFGGKNSLLPSLKKRAAITPLAQSLVEKYPGRYGIFIKDLKTQEVYGINQDEKFPAASLYKLAVMYKAYEAIEQKQISKDDLLSQDKFTLDRVLEGIQDERLKEEESESEIVSHTVENALRLMITISDNYSAILLAEKLGWQNIDALMEKEGFQAIDLVEEDAPTVTARAAAELFERIYSNKAVDTKASEEMKKLLFAQKINDRIPKYLPREVKVAHKTGELEQIRHDGGIVLAKKSHYIFVFLSETPVPEEASENIALMAQKIYIALEDQKP